MAGSDAKQGETRPPASTRSPKVKKPSDKCRVDIPSSSSIWREVVAAKSTNLKLANASTIHLMGKGTNLVSDPKPAILIPKEFGKPNARKAPSSWAALLREINAPVDSEKKICINEKIKHIQCISPNEKRSRNGRRKPSLTSSCDPPTHTITPLLSPPSINLSSIMPDVQALVTDFVLKLRRRKIEGSQATAKQTAELLRQVVSQQRMPYTNQAAALIDAVKAVGEQLIAANPIELAVGNIVRRVLHIIREENLSSTTAAIEGLGLTAGSDDDEGEKEDHPGLSAAAVAAAARSTLRAPSLQTLLEDIPESAVRPPSSSGDSEGKSKSADKSSRSKKLKHDVIEAINELIQDIDTCHELISEQAVEHIHQNEVILTLGRSRTVKEFLCAAKEKKRSFRVFVAEGGPRYQGHVLAKELVEQGLQTTVITDSAVFAMISRVNMVIVGAHAIMANGGVIAPVGINMVALAAQRHAVPFVVVAGSHKLCPLYPHNPEVLLNELKCPSDLLDFGEFSDCMDFDSLGGSLLHVANPTFDYVQSKLVSLFITDT
ncbi:hypothetical protein Cni_G20761 [Canna indica]|uniref:Translation initiation factor eIF2B subunit beta n=1 Tax=Canna indica TaxID=4628 RepID=A0AAQ3KN85_9LILI|nr:hypothetical protein Cni_G20761 [Canna indica]